MTRKTWVLTLLALGLLAVLTACGEQPQVQALKKLTVVGGGSVSVTSATALTNGVYYEPRVNKTADVSSVDATSGSADLSYTLTVTKVIVNQTYSATVQSVTVSNTESSAVTVDINGQLVCEPGGTLIANASYSQPDVTIAAGGSYTSPAYGPFDVSTCGDNVSNVVTVVNHGTTTPVLASNTSQATVTTTDYNKDAWLVDTETIPTGYTVTNATLSFGGSAVDVNASTSGSDYTIKTVAPAQVGTYSLAKQITRDSGVACAPATVLNTGSLVDASGNLVGPASQASIDLTCSPPPSVICTGTVGYWKNHDWPAGFDPSADFYSSKYPSGFTWLGILSEPVKGRPYVQLAQQFIAAMLNVQRNIPAAPPDVQTALYWSEWYFETHTIDSKADKSDATYNAGVLENFNSGSDGVPHC